MCGDFGRWKGRGCLRRERGLARPVQARAGPQTRARRVLLHGPGSEAGAAALDAAAAALDRAAGRCFRHGLTDMGLAVKRPSTEQRPPTKLTARRGAGLAARSTPAPARIPPLADGMGWWGAAGGGERGGWVGGP